MTPRSLLPLPGMLFVLSGCASTTPAVAPAPPAPAPAPLPAPAAPAPPAAAELPSQLEQAEALFAEFSYREAAECLERVLAREPENQRALVLQQRIELLVHSCPPSRARDLGELLAERRRSIEEARRTVDARVRAADRLLAEGRRAESAQLCEGALEALRWFPYTLDPALEAHARDVFGRAWPRPGEWEAAGPEAEHPPRRPGRE